MPKENLLGWFDPKFKATSQSNLLPVLNAYNDNKQNNSVSELNKFEITSQPGCSISQGKEIIDSTTDLNSLSNVEEILEKIIFNSEELISLKNAIEQVINGTMKLSQFKSFILHGYIRIFEDLMSFIPFFLRQQIIPNGAYNSQLADELTQKNQFLKVVSERITSIYYNLKKKGLNIGQEDEQKESEEEGYGIYLREVEEINADAQKAYEEGRYRDYLWRAKTRIERLVRLLYIKTHQLEVYVELEVKVPEMIKEIGKSLGYWFRTLDPYKSFNQVRNDVVHKYAKPPKEEVDKVKNAYDALFEELNEIFFNL